MEFSKTRRFLHKLEKNSKGLQIFLTQIEGYYYSKPTSYDSLFIYYQIRTHKVRTINEARIFAYKISYTNLVTDKSLLYNLDDVYNTKE